MIVEEILVNGSGLPVEFWRRRARDVLISLVGDTRMEGHFAYKFKMEFDANGNRLFRESFGALNFEKHAARIGPGVVPIGIVLYVDGTSMFTNVSARPVYGKYTVK